MIRPTLNTEIYAEIHPDNFKDQFKDKLVIVTGAARGIGRHISLAFAKAGATLALLDFDVERQSETKSLCEAEGAKVYVFGCDVTKYVQCCKAVEEVDKLGSIDVLVNNAGGGPIRGFVGQKFEEFWAGIEQNFKGVDSLNPCLIIGNDYDASCASRDEGTAEGMYHQHCVEVA